MSSVHVQSRRRLPRAAAGLILAAVVAAGGCAAQYHQYEGCVVPCGYTAPPPLPFENYGSLPCADPSPRYCFPVDESPQPAPRSAPVPPAASPAPAEAPGT